MSKRVECSVKRFKGAVEFKDPLPYDVTLRFEAAGRRNAARKKAGEELSAGEIYFEFIPVFIDAVEKWELKNFPEKPTVDTFPGTPRVAIYQLTAWLLNELSAIYQGDEDPNA